MDNPRIYESVILTNRKLEGIMARLNYLLMELDNPKSTIYFATEAVESKEVMSNEKKFFEHFPLDSREVRKAVVKPHLETLHEVVAMTETVYEVLARMQEAGVHLDLSTNPTLSMPTLAMVASLTTMLLLLFSSLLEPARILPEIFVNLTQSNEEAIKVLRKFLQQYAAPHPLDILQEKLAPYKEMVSRGVVSATKVLARNRLQVQTQLLSMFQTQAGLTTPDQMQSLSLGYRDTLQSVDVARNVFLSFLAVGTTWDAKEKSGGFDVLKAVLTSGWVLHLQRDQNTSLHSTIINMLNRGKDKKKSDKKKMIEAWEKEALKDAPLERKDQRRKLADLMEKYCILMEDQPFLLGPRILLILTLLSHAASEVHWLVLHQNSKTKRRPEKEGEVAMATDKETIRLLYYIVRLRELLTMNADWIRADMIAAVQEQMAGLHEQEGVKMAALDLNMEWRDMMDRVTEGVAAITCSHQDGVLAVSNDLHRHDLGRLVASLSCQHVTSSSPAQSCPQMIQSLELVFLQIFLIKDPARVARQLSHLGILYSFIETFEDYFEHLLRFDDLFSHLIAFPALCQDFPVVLQGDCPEEYEGLLDTTRRTANTFLDKMATTTVKLLDQYCMLAIRQDRDDINIPTAAKAFHEKEQETKRKEMEKLAKERGDKIKKDERRKRKMTMKKVQEKRKVLFEKEIEKITIPMKQMFSIFEAQPRLSIAGVIFRPTAAFQDKMFDKVMEKVKELIKLEGKMQKPVLPTVVRQSLKTFQATLANIDPGLHFHTMFQEAVHSLHTEDPHPYLVKYVDKVLKTLNSPQCYYSEHLSCFLAISKDISLLSDPIERLTSVQELEALCDIFGVEGQLFLAERLGQAAAAQVAKLGGVLAANQALLADPEAREKEASWKGLQQIPEFLSSIVTLGKVVALADLVDAAVLTVTKERAGFLEAAVEMMLTCDQSLVLGVPDSMVTVASAMGHTKCEGEGEAGKMQAEQVVMMTSVVLPLLARLEAMRFYPHLMGQQNPEEAPDLLEVHHSSLTVLAQALRHLGGSPGAEGEGARLLARTALTLPSIGDPRSSGSLGTLILALALLPQETGVPYSLNYSAHKTAMVDTSRIPTESLENEFMSRKVQKMFRK